MALSKTKMISGITLILLFVSTFVLATNHQAFGTSGSLSSSSPFSDEFNSTMLDPRWTWVNPLGDCNYSLTANPGYLRISVPTGNPDHGLGNQPMGNPDHAPRMMQSANGDFIIETKVLFNPQYDAQGAGILVWKDWSHYLGIGRCDNWANPDRIQYFYVYNGTSFEDHSTLYSGNVTYLQIQRSGDTFTFRYSADGINWITLSSTSIPLGDAVNIGLCVYDQYQTHPIYADFDYFRVWVLAVPEFSSSIVVAVVITAVTLGAVVLSRRPKKSCPEGFGK